jgi:hypothetical protein
MCVSPWVVIPIHYTIITLIFHVIMQLWWGTYLITAVKLSLIPLLYHLLLQWDGQDISCIRETTSTYKLWILKEKELFRNLDIDGRIILKLRILIWEWDVVKFWTGWGQIQWWPFVNVMLNLHSSIETENFLSCCMSTVNCSRRISALELFTLL